MCQLKPHQLFHNTHSKTVLVYDRCEAEINGAEETAVYQLFPHCVSVSVITTISGDPVRRCERLLSVMLSLRMTMTFTGSAIHPSGPSISGVINVENVTCVRLHCTVLYMHSIYSVLHYSDK